MFGWLVYFRHEKQSGVDALYKMILDAFVGVALVVGYWIVSSTVVVTYRATKWLVFGTPKTPQELRLEDLEARLAELQQQSITTTQQPLEPPQQQVELVPAPLALQAQPSLEKA
jgi:hypothetical protein